MTDRDKGNVLGCKRSSTIRKDGSSGIRTARSRRLLNKRKKKSKNNCVKGGERMPTNAQKIIRAAPRYLGVPYSEMDCQAFVEKCLADAGIRKNLAGSNAWFREVMRDGWVGTPEECKKKYGKIPRGAFLFVLKQDGGEPEKYQGDGIGNANHIGIYTGMTGAEMVELSGNPENKRYNFGDGAINSSSSRGFVCTSRFNGKSISGGWNRIGLWDRIDYTDGGGDGVEVTYRAQVIGGALNVRAEPKKASDRLGQLPEGSIVTVTEDLAGWSRIDYDGKNGYVMSQYLKKIREEPEEEKIMVSKKELQEIYDKIGKMLEG